MKRDPIKRVQVDLEEIKKEEKAESLYYWEEIELVIQKMIEEEETPEEKERRMREPTFGEVVTEILYHYDLMDFAKNGLPEDEYDIEAYPIVHNLHRVDDIVSLRWLVYDVFVWAFSEISAPESGDIRYRYIAEEIWDEWQYRIARSEEARKKELKKRWEAHVGKENLENEK